MKIVFLSFLFLILASCATSTVGMSPSNVPVTNREFEVLGSAETTVSWTTFDMVLLGGSMGSPPMDEAVQNLLAEHQGDALVNLRYWTDRTIILFITLNRLHLEADVVKFL